MTLEAQVYAAREIAFFRQHCRDVLRVLVVGGRECNVVGTDAGATQHVEGVQLGSLRLAKVCNRQIELSLIFGILGGQSRQSLDLRDRVAFDS